VGAIVVDCMRAPKICPPARLSRFLRPLRIQLHRVKFWGEKVAERVEYHSDSRRHVKLLSPAVHRPDVFSASCSHASISLRAIEIGGGTIGIASRRNHPASAISDGSQAISPD